MGRASAGVERRGERDADTGSAGAGEGEVEGGIQMAGCAKRGAGGRGGRGGVRRGAGVAGTQ